MTSRATALIRCLLTIALTSLVLMLVPLVLTAQESSAPNTRAAPTSAEAPETSAGAAGVFSDSVAAQSIFTSGLAAKLHPEVLKQWLTGASEQQPVLIQMQAQADLSRAAIGSAPSIAARRAAVVNSLQVTAKRSQAGVLALLAKAQQAGGASTVRSLWINNSIAARVDRAVLLQIAARDDVAFIQPDRYRKWIDVDLDPREASTRSVQPAISSLYAPTALQWNIQRIRADLVWSALNISGTGIVVANMDTGVDWQHPALSGSYRGVSPKGLVDHLYSWFDATSEQTQYPYDGSSHGTHTMGTLVGTGGIGVAPGAKWIAARIFDSQGFAYDSWIHAGFQWILAPGGDPAQAPDVLSNSWGSTDGTDTQFQPDVRLLNAAGIDTYFSNGNAGPGSDTVGSPASFSESFGVGAVDNTEQVAYFSSRGPSPWSQLKPQVVAPGVAILSSIPGGGYRQYDGTSMAAPQAAGIAALMRSAVSGLTITQTRYALTTTAAQIISATYPNNDYGWGRVDAFNAVVSVLHTGAISGVVRDSATSAPIPFASVRADSRLGTWNDVVADEAGRYTVYGASSLYTLTASAFGHQSRALAAVPIVTGTITLRDIALTPLPQGWVVGRVTDLTGTRLLTASLSVLDDPVTITAHGIYSWGLPAGTHVLRAQASAHRIVTAAVTITAGQTVTQNLMLPDAPSILLVDSGRWYNGSVIAYYRQALDDLNYLYDEWPIIDLRVDLPTTPTLRAHKVVIWSAPFDSPGIIGAGDVISDFLSTGGRLLISGQDVGYYDDWLSSEPYYYSKLMARLVADDASTRHLTGTHAFAGITLAISGTGGADNQLYPDVIQSRAPALTEPAFDYTIDQNGGQTVGLCRPYRAVYLPFGYEAINDRSTRAEVLARTFAVFARPAVRNTFGFGQTPNLLIAPPGSLITNMITLTNFDEVSPLTFTLAAQSAWNVRLTPQQVSVKSCESQPITYTVRIPPGIVRDASQSITITAQSVAPSGFVTSTVLLAKAPASVLLVDDDRWYPVDGAYRSALAANGISYDVWRVPTSWPGPEPAAPTSERLSWYPEVIWFTGYDWYQTLTPSNTQALQGYLQQGGRLFLSSQDLLSAPGIDNFKRNTLGVLTESVDLTAALISGVQTGWFDGLVHLPLNTPYTNYDDALAPQRDAKAVLVGEHGWPVALAHDMGISKTLFMAFGFEGLPAASQPDALDRAIGFLSRLGHSNVTTDRAITRPGDAITATLVIENDGAAAIEQAAVTMTVPVSVTTLGGDALTWTGALEAGQIVTRHMILKLADNIKAGTIITLPVEFRDVDQMLRFTRAARINVEGPRLELSYAPMAATAVPGYVVTWTLTVRNSGALIAPVTVTLGVPFEQTLISDSLQTNSGVLITREGRIEWLGPLGLGEVLTVTYRLTTLTTLSPLWLYGSATAGTDQTVWQAGEYLQVVPYRAFLPVVRKLK